MGLGVLRVAKTSTHIRLVGCALCRASGRLPDSNTGGMCVCSETKMSRSSTLPLVYGRLFVVLASGHCWKHVMCGLFTALGRGSAMGLAFTGQPASHEITRLIDTFLLGHLSGIGTLDEHTMPAFLSCLLTVYKKCSIVE